MRSLSWLLVLGCIQPVSAVPADWPAYGRDPGGARYSPLVQINTSNDDAGAHDLPHRRKGGRSFESTPIFVDNVLYVSTHTQKVIALDPETGRELWRYDAKAPGRENRGVSYWPGDGEDAARILLGTGDGRLIALSAKPGVPIQSFGDNRVIDLRAGITDKYPKAMYAITSPPTIYKDLVIVGPATPEGPSGGPSGDPRAFDVRTGKLRWRFHVIPESGESWGKDGGKDRSGPSQWGFATLDAERGMLFLPVGNPADSFYGADLRGRILRELRGGAGCGDGEDVILPVASRHLGHDWRRPRPAEVKRAARLSWPWRKSPRWASCSFWTG